MHRILRHTLLLATVSITVLTGSASGMTQRTEVYDVDTIQNSASEHVQQRELPSIQRGVCGTEEPSSRLKDAHKRLSQTQYRHAGGKNIDTNASHATAAQWPRIEVDTWFHIVSTSEQVDLVTNSMIASQVCCCWCVSAPQMYEYMLMCRDTVRISATIIPKYRHTLQPYRCRSQHQRHMGAERGFGRYETDSSTGFIRHSQRLFPDESRSVGSWR